MNSRLGWVQRRRNEKRDGEAHNADVKWLIAYSKSANRLAIESLKLAGTNTVLRMNQGSALKTSGVKPAPEGRLRWRSTRKLLAARRTSRTTAAKGCNVLSQPSSWVRPGIGTNCTSNAPEELLLILNN